MEKRNETIILRVTKSERVRIQEKMEELGIRNMSAYIRKMALDGYCVKLDLEDVREMVSLLRYCSNNLNQYARKANVTGNIYEEDIRDIQNRQEELWEQARQILLRLSSI